MAARITVKRSDLRRAAALSWLLCAAMAASAAGCSGERKVEQRRALLKPRDYRAKFEAEQRARQLYDERGELLESDQSVAGIVLPKGVTLAREFDHQWFYQSTEIPLDKLEGYFAQRLISKTVEHGQGSVVFDAVPVNDIKASPLRIEISSLRGSNGTAEIYIRQAVKFEPKIPLDQVEAQLRAAREHAD